MSIIDLFESSEHRNNVAHFTAFAHLAAVDGKIDRDAEILVKRFADKLDISKEEYQHGIDTMSSYRIPSVANPKKRLTRLHDLFNIIYTKHYMNAQEQKLIVKYAITLGFDEEKANDIIDKSIKLFGGKIAFDTYELLISS